MNVAITASDPEQMHAEIKMSISMLIRMLSYLKAAAKKSPTLALGYQTCGRSF
jgi:hypothetical protein